MKNKLLQKFCAVFTAFAFVSILTVLPAKANDNTTNKPTKNIVETADAAGNFTILKKALEATGLTETLKTGNFTVFAPTDEAFSKLPAGTLDNLLKDKEALKKILLYHVVEGKMMASDVVKQTELKTVEGTTARVKVKEGGKVKINKAKILKTDITATNGVIHAIDSVIMPSDKTYKDKAKTY